MKVVALIAVATFLLAAAEASAQSVRSIRCKNGGYVGMVWCCKVNSAQCARTAAAAQPQLRGRTFWTRA
jgi:hypothetical protein